MAMAMTVAMPVMSMAMLVIVTMIVAGFVRSVGVAVRMAMVVFVIMPMIVIVTMFMRMAGILIVSVLGVPVSRDGRVVVVVFVSHGAQPIVKALRTLLHS